MSSLLRFIENNRARKEQDLLEQFKADALMSGLTDPSRAKVKRDGKLVDAGYGNPDPKELTKDILAFAEDQGVKPSLAMQAASELDPFVARPEEPKIMSADGNIYAVTPDKARPLTQNEDPEKKNLPYKIGSRQTFRGSGGKEFEGTFVGLDAENNPIWRNEVEIPQKPAGGSGNEPGTLKLENLVDNIRSVRSKIASLTAGENILSEAMSEKRPEAISQLQEQLGREMNLLLENFPDAARVMGLGDQLAKYRFDKDPEMRGRNLGEFNAQAGGYEVYEGDQLIGYYTLD